MKTDASKATGSLPSTPHLALDIDEMDCVAAAANNVVTGPPRQWQECGDRDISHRTRCRISGVGEAAEDVQTVA